MAILLHIIPIICLIISTIIGFWLFSQEYMLRKKYEDLMLRDIGEENRLQAEINRLKHLLDPGEEKMIRMPDDKEVIMMIKYFGRASTAPYQYYKSLGVKVPDWALECYANYRKVHKAKRKEQK